MNQRWSLWVPGSISLAAYHNFLLRYLLDHILSFQIQISQVTKFLQGIFFFNAVILLGNIFGSANVFIFYIYLLLLYCVLFWCFLLECKLHVCLMVAVVYIYHFLHLSFCLCLFFLYSKGSCQVYGLHPELLQLLRGNRLSWLFLTIFNLMLTSLIFRCCL